MSPKCVYCTLKSNPSLQPPVLSWKKWESSCNFKPLTSRPVSSSSYLFVYSWVANGRQLITFTVLSDSYTIVFCYSFSFSCWTLPCLFCSSVKQRVYFSCSCLKKRHQREKLDQHPDHVRNDLLPFRPNLKTQICDSVKLLFILLILFLILD